MNELYDQKKSDTYSEKFLSKIHTLHGHFGHAQEIITDYVYLLLYLSVNNVLSHHFFTISSSFASAAPLSFSIQCCHRLISIIALYCRIFDAYTAIFVGGLQALAVLINRFTILAFNLFYRDKFAALQVKSNSELYAKKEDQ